MALEAGKFFQVWLSFYYAVGLTMQQPVVGVDPWVDVNQPTTLTCLPSGTPREVEWIKCVVHEQSCTASRPSSELVVRLLGSDVNWGGSIDISRFRFDKTQSNYPLTITSVTLEDESVYSCRTNVAGQGYQSASAPMRIRVPPSSIAVVYDSTSHSSSTSIPIVAGENHQFTCNTPAVKPAATLTWTIPAGGSSDQPLGNQTNTPNTGNNNLTDSYNTVIVDIPKNPAVSQIVCAATNRQDGSNAADIDIAVTLQVR
ncbi:uncharacterized protein LOC110990791, partial [Acanthaster planci]|uniref:Uncharacterized protein LOC110990791 n=1 Tax=Acanthaster planci TaxID=133434 RepID=A0A8B8A3S9_ACAPL